MINPQPVYGSNSPYGAAPGSKPPTQPTSTPQQSPKKPRRWKRFFLVVFLGMLVGAGAFAYTEYRSFKQDISVDNEGDNSAILQYSEDSKIDPAQFKKLGDGRFTMVLVGIDKAAGLTDSIQVFSLDTINKKSSIISIPRDMYVTIPGHGRNKINAAYKFGEGDHAGGGATLLKQVIGNVVGTEITNFALIDFTGLRDIVDALGGIEINVTKAIVDPLFPAETGDGYSPFSIKIGKQTLDGKTALKYARSRETTSDFDRARRQQEVIEAIRAKALSAGVLTNPIKLNNILKAISKNFKTDLDIDQMKTVISLYDQVTDANKFNFNIDTSAELGLLTASSDTPAGYISYPILGIDKNTDIWRWYRKNNPDPLLAKDGTTTISVINGGKATEKQMNEFVATLNDLGFSATISKDAYNGSKLAVTTLFSDDPDEKPFTKNYLSNYLGVTIQDGNPAKTGSNFEIVYFPTTQTSANVSSTKAKTSPSPSPTAKP